MWRLPNHLQITTLVHTHTHTLAPSILPLLEAPAEGFFWNLLEFCHHIRFDVLHVCETRPLRPILIVGNSQKSLGARSREYGGWVMTGMVFSVRNCCTTSDVWLGALSWCRNHSPFCLSSRFLWNASHNPCKTSTYNWPLTLSLLMSYIYIYVWSS